MAACFRVGSFFFLLFSIWVPFSVYMIMIRDNDKLSIRQWMEGDRPREKMLEKGRGYLSDAELLAILLGSGTVDASALELSRHMLREVGDSLHELGKMEVQELMQFKGVGPAKAVTILAAMEIGYRRQSSMSGVKPLISSSKDAYTLMLPHLADVAYEEFWVMALNRANRVIGRIMISEGGISGTVADPKKIFKIALDRKASSIIVCHNHPSGNIKPSEMDIRLTRKLKEAGILLELPVIDHLIIGDGKYFSFADEGIL